MIEDFFEIGPAHATEFRIWIKYWINLPILCLCHNPKNWNFGKVSWRVSHDFPIRVKNSATYCQPEVFSERKVKIIALQVSCLAMFGIIIAIAIQQKKKWSSEHVSAPPRQPDPH